MYQKLFNSKNPGPETKAKTVVLLFPYHSQAAFSNSHLGMRNKYLPKNENTAFQVQL